MERYCLVGCVRLDFIAKDTGNQVKGYNLWVGKTFEDGVGYFPWKVFLTDKQFEPVFSAYGGMKGISDHLFKECSITWNEYGKPTKIVFGK